MTKKATTGSTAKKTTTRKTTTRKTNTRKATPKEQLGAAMVDPDLKKRVELGINRLTAISMLAQASSDYGVEIATYDGQRSYDKVFGYPATITYEMYLRAYRRGGIAKTIVNLPATSVWRGDITVSTPTNDKGKKTPQGEDFEKKWNEIWKKKSVRDTFLRADKLAGIGNYSVIRLGLSGDADFGEPVNGKNHTLEYLSVFSQPNAEPATWVTDTADPEYGMIDKYNLQLTRNTQVVTGGTAFPSTEASVPTHRSRIVHIAPDILEDKVFGTPRLQSCWNALLDYLKLLGGSAEMYFRGAFPGFNFKLDPEAQVSDAALEKMEEQIQNMILGLGRWTQTEGVTTESVAPQVVDPSNQIEVHVNDISATSRIPKRKLMGSERGELASGQDEANWNAETECRRENDGDRWLRQFIDKLIAVGALPEVEDYTIEWPELEAEKALENSQIAQNTANAIATFLNADGERAMPLSTFFEEVLNWDKEKAQAIADEVEGMREDEEVDETQVSAAMESIAAYIQTMEAAADDQGGDPSTEDV